MTFRPVRPTLLVRTTLLATALLLTVHAGRAVAVPASPIAADASGDIGQSLGLQGTKPNFDKVEIASPHVYDYTFASAPTDWRVQSGAWEMTNRWACSPGWSWFGGRSDEIAAIWNKRKFSGDVSVQFYFGFIMGVAGIGSGQPGDWWNRTKLWEYPSDAAVTIGGDGRDLSKGYSLIVGADENQHTLLRRGTKVVAESSAPEALLPSFADGGPDEGHDFNEVHRRWWYVRIDKIGSKVTCYLDGKELFTYDDPQPLDAGQVALWTYNNGIVLSRVQIYYQDEVKRAYARHPFGATAAPRVASNALPRHTNSASPRTPVSHRNVRPARRAQLDR